MDDVIQQMMMRLMVQTQQVTTYFATKAIG